MGNGHGKGRALQKWFVDLLPDKILLQLWIAGHTEAFDTLFLRHWEPMKLLVLKEFPKFDVARAEDAAANVFSYLVKRKATDPETVRSIRNFKSYLQASVLNKATDIWRAEKKHESHDQDEEKKSVIAKLAVPPIEVAGKAEQVVFEVLNLLPPRRKRVFEYREFNDWPHKLIAENLGITVGTSKTTYKAAREQFESLLKERDCKWEDCKSVFKNLVK